MARRHLMRLVVGIVIVLLVTFTLTRTRERVRSPFDPSTFEDDEDAACRPDADCNHPPSPFDSLVKELLTPDPKPAKALPPKPGSETQPERPEAASTSYKPFPTYAPLPLHYKPKYKPQSKESYTRTIVIAKLEAEDLTWFYDDTILPSSLNYTKLHYTIDGIRPGQPDAVPANRGHEAMAYLTHIIKYYDTLPDITVFMHAHRKAWHNNDLLNADAVETLVRLNPAYVHRKGYVNLRCHTDPGCPAYLRPKTVMPFEENRPEQKFVGYAFKQLFPGEELPDALSQPCCAQFAVSRAAVHRLSRKRYEELRQWLIDTYIADTITGRIFEYLWQYIFTGHSELCRDMLSCYCDGFGVCFEDATAEGAVLDGWMQIQDFTMMKLELRDHLKEVDRLIDGEVNYAGSAEDVQAQKDRVLQLRERNKWLEAEISKRHDRAQALGDDANFRVKAVEKAGRGTVDL